MGGGIARSSASANALAVVATICLGSLPQGALAVMRGSCTAEEAHRYPSGYPKKLDFGIYWFGLNDAWQKAVPGNRSQYFDPSKSTLIFIHGWSGNAGGATASCYRPTTICDADVCPDQRPMADAWFRNGWNVGFLYWDQFADEPCARDAEQKVWFQSRREADGSDAGGKGFRWAQYELGDDGRQFRMYSTKAKSIAELCADSISDSMADFKGSELRFVGHSLGTQLATHCAALLHTRRSWHGPKPTRLVLLDPFFTERHLHGMFRCEKMEYMDKGIGSWTVHEATKKIELLYGKGVPTEVHLSSPFPESEYLGSPILPFEPLVVLIRRMPTWCGSVMSVEALDHIGCRHKAAVILYFLAGGDPVGKAAFCNPALPLGCSDDQLWELQNLQQSLADEGYQQSWEQRNGLGTRRTTDDVFTRVENPLGKEGLEGVREYRRFKKLRKRPGHAESVNEQLGNDVGYDSNDESGVEVPIVKVHRRDMNVSQLTVANKEAPRLRSTVATASRSDDGQLTRGICGFLLLACSVGCCWLRSPGFPCRWRKPRMELRVHLRTESREDETSEHPESPSFVESGTE